MTFFYSKLNSTHYSYLYSKGPNHPKSQILCHKKSPTWDFVRKTLEPWHSKGGANFKKKRGKPAIIEFSVRFILMLHYKFARKPRLERECGMFIVEFQACVYSIDCVHKSRKVKNTPIVVVSFR